MDRTIKDPADWRGAELAATDRWIHVFSTSEIDEVDAALKFARGRGVSLPELSKNDFPLPTVSAVLSRALEQLEDGPGLHLLRGLPAERYSKEDLRLMYWGLGKHLGSAVSQSSKGDLLGDVRNLNVVLDGQKGRGYTSNEKLNYHTDFCDVVALFVLRTAKSGGLSMLGSTIAIHNEIARRRPDLLDVLYQPFPYSWQGQEAPGTKPWYQLPVFTMHKGKFACLCVRSHIRSSQRYEDAPRLTGAQEEALDLFDALAAGEAFHFATMFQPGDLQLINNHVLYHSRTAFEDHPEPEQHRHLLRLWLAVPNSRELSPGLAPIYQDRSRGAVRGGFPSLSGKYVFETAGEAA